jgi:hypothetical protein
LRLLAREAKHFFLAAITQRRPVPGVSPAVAAEVDYWQAESGRQCQNCHEPEHIDCAPKVWTVTKTMKIDGHRVPLANAAISVLRKMKSDDEGDTPVFPAL